MNNQDGKIYYGLGLDNSQLQEDANRSMSIIKGIGDSSVAEGARIDNAYKKIAGTVAAVFTTQKAIEFAKSIVQVRGEIESLEISFETLLGSKEKADALFGEIRSFAANTPMELAPLAKGAQTLLSFNVEAEKVMPILRQIGDISMGNSDKFNSLTLAFSQMYSTGKLMGQDLLQMINAGFNPLTVIAEKTGKSISVLKDEMSAGAISVDMVADAFASAASEGGQFYGMLEKQSKGINGSISNLKGAIDDMLNDLGTKSQDVITTTIGGATTLVKNYESIGKAIGEIVIAYGAYKAALIVINSLQTLNSAILKQAVIEKRLAAAAGIQLANAEAVASARTKFLIIAQQGLVKALQATKVALLSNPYTLAAAAVTALAYGVYKLVTYQTDAEKAQNRLNDAIKDAEKASLGETRELARLKGELSAATKGSDEYNRIKEKIVSNYGKYHNGLADEIEKVGLLDSTYKKLTESIQASFAARQYEKFQQAE
ncbi:tape measure protein, partial [Parabacteroides sp. OttesenSCG-928-B22]|nr:tape measure protein [Parabacteroides sp. OttesenSCG-928-B22]